MVTSRAVDPVPIAAAAGYGVIAALAAWRAVTAEAVLPQLVAAALFLVMSFLAARSARSATCTITITADAITRAGRLGWSLARDEVAYYDVRHLLGRTYLILVPYSDEPTTRRSRALLSGQVPPGSAIGPVEDVLVDDVAQAVSQSPATARYRPISQRPPST